MLYSSKSIPFHITLNFLKGLGNFINACLPVSDKHELLLIQSNYNENQIYNFIELMESIVITLKPLLIDSSSADDFALFLESLLEHLSNQIEQCNTLQQQNKLLLEKFVTVTSDLFDSLNILLFKRTLLKKVLIQYYNLIN